MSDAVLFPAAKAETLVEVLDRLLDTGAVIDGHLVVSVAGVDLVFVGLRALLASVESAGRLMAPQATVKSI